MCCFWSSVVSTEPGICLREEGSRGTVPILQLEVEFALKLMGRSTLDGRTGDLPLLLRPRPHLLPQRDSFE